MYKITKETIDNIRKAEMASLKMQYALSKHREFSGV